MTRHSPGLPAETTVADGTLTTEQVRRHRLPRTGPNRNPALRPIIGTAVSVVLLIAAVVVIVARLHHPAFGVNGVAVTGQTRQGCTVTVAGRIDTSGGAGTVSYEWLFQPQMSAPRALSQSVAAGQTALYVTAAVEGMGHGSVAQAATLKVLGPGPARAATTHLTVSC